MTASPRFQRISYDQGKKLGLDFSAAFALDPAVADELDYTHGYQYEGGLGALSVAEYVRRRPKTLVARAKHEKPKIRSLVRPRGVPRTLSSLRMRPTALRKQRILYVDRGKGDLYMEVAVPSSTSATEFYKVHKLLETEVRESCIVCHSREWRLVSDQVVTKHERGAKYSCFKLSFLCTVCGKKRVTAGTRLRSIFDRVGKSVGETFRRLRGFEVSGDLKSPALKAKLDRGKVELERC